MRFRFTLPSFGASLISGTIFVSFSVALSVTANCQESVESNYEAERRFSAAVEDFRSRKFFDAHRQFLSVYSDYPLHQRTTAAYVMHGKTLSRLGMSQASNEILSEFLQKFPASLYVGDARYTMALNALRDRNPANALRQFLWAIEKGSDSSTSANAESLVRVIVERMPSMVDVNRIHREFSGLPSGDFFTYVLAERSYAEDDIRNARELLQVLVRDSLESEFAERARALLRHIEGGGRVKIGVLLPLFSKARDVALQQLGQEFLAGIRLAVDEHNSDPRSYAKVAVEIRDTERDPVVALRVIQELVSDSEIVAIVGPVFSAEVLATAGVANANGVPLISPTANANGIASVGQYIFQANPDYTSRGKAMAQYAVEKGGYLTLAVLAPIDAVGKYMAESFIEEATRLHATVVATEWYGTGTTDLYPQFRSIREKGLIEQADPLLTFRGRLQDGLLEKLISAGAQERLVDSLLEHGSTVGVSELLGEDGRRIADSLGFPVIYPELKLDSLHIPVLAIDAIYIPITSPDEIGIVSSQLVYYNLQAQILGTGDWNDFGELEANKSYVDGVLFTSDTYVHPGDTSYQHLLQQILETMSLRATNNTLFAYDTMRLVLSVVDDGAITRDQIAERLASIRKFKGLHTSISFSERVNSELHILQYREGEVRSVDRITVDESSLPEPP
ncbi:MAG: ABC transporter substrate-binding protein [Bacteroidota bacterium]